MSALTTIIPLEEKRLPDNCYLFKHSTRCPISTAAAEEVKASSPTLPIYWVNVVEQRELSNWVAETYDVEHQSPQLILISKGLAEASWTHRVVKRQLLSV